MTTANIICIFNDHGGLPVIVKTDGTLDGNRWRALQAGESLIRLPRCVRISNPSVSEEVYDESGFVMVSVSSDAPLGVLPVGTKLIFRGDGAFPLDPASIRYQSLVPNAAIAFFAGDTGVSVSASSGLSLAAADGWLQIVLEKTGVNTWLASGDLAPA